MTRLVKIIDNKYVQIKEYKSPNICFNTNEYSDFEDYCTLRETFDPFEIFCENQELKKQVEERTKMYQNAYDYSQKMEGKAIILENQQKEFIKYLEDEINALNVVNSTPCGLSFENEITRKVYQEILQKYKGIMGDDK